MDSTINTFKRIFLEEARIAGVRPDLTSNREKNQPPMTMVTSMGVRFNTDSWTWLYGRGTDHDTTYTSEVRKRQSHSNISDGFTSREAKHYLFYNK